MADGHLNFDTKVNEKGFTDGISTLERAIGTLEKTIATLSKNTHDSFTINASQPVQAVETISSSIVKLGKSSISTGEKIQAVQKRMEELEHTGIATKEYEEVVNAIEKTQAALNKLNERQIKMEDTGVKEESRAYKNLIYDIQQTERALNDLIGYRKTLKNEGNWYTEGTGTEEYARLQRELRQLTAQEERESPLNQTYKQLETDINKSSQSLERLLERQAKLDSMGTDKSAKSYESLQYDIRKAADALQELLDKKARMDNGMGVSEPFDTGALQNKINAIATAQRAASAAASANSDSTNNLSNAQGKATRTSGQLKESLKNTGKSMNSTKKQNDSLAKGFFKLGNMFRLMLLRMAMRTVVEGVKKGFENLAKYSQDFNKDISTLMSSMTLLKNSFATAFAPILSAVVPMIKTLINYVVMAVNAFGQFAAALFGKGTFIKAKEVQEDYAASLDKTGSAAKKASKQLAAFDELNLMNEQDSSGGASGGAGGIDPKDMFETVEIDKKIIDSVDKFKDALKPTIEALGRLNDALEPLKKFTFGTLKDFYESFLKPVGKWVLGEGLPRFLDITTDLVKKINWEKLRASLKGLYEQLERFTRFVFTGVLDFYEKFLKPVATWTINTALTRLIDMVVQFAEKINWDKINKALGVFWDGLSKFAIGIGDGLLNFVTGLAKVLTPLVVSLIDGMATAIEFLGRIVGSVDPGALRALGGAIGAICLEIMAFQAMQGVWKIIQNVGNALSGFMTSVSSHPILIIVGLLAALAGAIISLNEGWKQDLADSLEDFMSGTKELRDQARRIADEIDQNIGKVGSKKESLDVEYGALQELANKYYELSRKQNKSNEEKALMLAYSQELIKKIPELRKSIDEETGAYKGTKDSLDGLIKKTKEYYLVQAAQESLVDLYKNIYEAEKNRSQLMGEMEGKTKRLTELQALHNDALENCTEIYDEFGNVITGEVGKEIKFLEQEIDALNGEYDNLGVALDGANKELEYTNGYIAEHAQNVEDAQKAVDNLNYAETTVNAANAIDELHGIWGENGAQILGEDAIKIYDEIMNGLEPLENGMYQLADGSMVQFGNAIKEGTPNVVSTLDNNLLAEINTSLSSSGKIIGFENGTLIIKEMISGADAKKDDLKNAFVGYATYSQEGFKNKVKELTPDIGSTMDRFAKDGVLSPFKNALDINSPSRKFKEYAEYVVEGFNDGIEGKQGTTKGFIGSWVDKVKGWFTKAFDINSPSGVGMDWGGFVVSGFNIGVLDSINSTKAVIKEWANAIEDSMPEFSAEFGVTGPEAVKLNAIPPMTLANIPHLATGAVIPPNSKFLAVLGDQTSGTNIEAPLDTIKQAFWEVAGQMFGEEALYNAICRANADSPLRAYVSSSEVFEATRAEAQYFKRNSGRPVFGD